MSRIFKAYEQNILPFSHAYEFQANEEDELLETDIEEQNSAQQQLENDIQQASDFNEHANDIITNAKTEANNLLSDALNEAKIKAEQEFLEANEKGFLQGKEIGYQAGYKLAYEEAYQKAFNDIEEKYIASLQEIRDIIDDLKDEKEKTYNKNVEVATNVAMAIAEKVIQVSLQSSEEVIEKMVAKALEDTKGSHKIKIYVSDLQAELIAKTDEELLQIIENRAQTVKVEVIKNADIGTCIIELDDKIIDASAKTQLQNIEEMIELEH